MTEVPGGSADKVHQQAEQTAAPSGAAAPPNSLNEFLQRAMTGDSSVLPQLQQHLDAHPSIWAEVGDLGANATNAWVTLIAGANLILGESLRRKVAAMRAELVKEDASPIERLLAQRVVAEWLQVQYADTMVAQFAGHSPKILAYWTKRQVETQRQYLAAIKALTDVARSSRGINASKATSRDETNRTSQYVADGQAIEPLRVVSSEG